MPAFSHSFKVLASTRSITTGSVVAFLEFFPLLECPLRRGLDFRVDMPVPPVQVAFRPPFHRVDSRRDSLRLGHLLIPHQRVSDVLDVIRQFLFLRDVLVWGV